MINKRTLIFAVVGALAVGLIVAQFIPSLKPIPAKHQSIVDGLEIVDTRTNFSLDCLFVDSDTPTLGYGLSTFTSGESYSHSTWLWQRGGETEWCMTIWGPGDDGNNYIVEFGRVSPGAFNIVRNGVVRAIFPESWITPSPGYWYMEVEM